MKRHKNVTILTTQVIFTLLLIFGAAFPIYSQIHLSDIELEQVNLQLRWKHQFQFAGYYAAVEKGFYREAGLDVNIKEGGVQSNVIDEVVSNRSQYGVTNSEILLQRSNGKPLIVLAAIFQHSPLVMISRKGTGINSPHDLIGKRVQFSTKSRDVELHAMFRNEGILLDYLDIMESGNNTYDDYFDDSITSIAAYATNEPFYYKQKNIPYTVFRPMTYGIDFYGDCLFTSENERDKYPKRVKAFREASLKGWTYAMRHPNEIISLIIDKYNPTKSREHLRFEAQEVRKLILPDLVEIGHMNPGR